MYKGKKILITGGTGSLGQALTNRLLKMEVDTIRIYSRNESKQIEMESKFHDERLRYFLGDVKDYERLDRALEDVDIVFHAAALKHVPKIEYNPFEAVKTNIVGSQNVINACLNNDVKIAVAIGTDKAVSPLNTYGATKLLMEKLFISASNYLNREKHHTIFLALRYGNVLGSSGSVVPRIINQIHKEKKISITHPEMTRFSILMDEALDFILESTLIGKGSEIFIPKLRSYSISDLKQAMMELLGNCKEEIIGIRPGEKMHETLINSDELKYTWEYDNKYILFSPYVSESELLKTHPHIKKPTFNFPSYSSNLVSKISKDELKDIISKEVLINF